ncbi:LysR family transcriptional regulator [Rhodococcus sp. 077-4]|uniref:LysR family transcriptional regulator n=1 Tax=Rhodococcus sp. 077-4 TaxID=2789271 RepID=UPI0039F5B810
MEIRQIQAVLAIAENGSFRKAARQLYLGQPTLSQHVRSLEVELGVALFERSAAGATLTRAGEQLIPRFTRVLATIGQLDQEAAELAAGGAGRVRVAAVSAAIAPAVIPALQQLQSTHPRLGITLTELLPSAIEEAVRSGVAEIGVVARSGIATPVEEHEVLQTGTIGLLVSSSSRLAAVGSITRDQLIDEQVILLPHGHLLRKFADGYFPDGMLRNAYEVSHHSTVEHLVSAGLGIALGPYRTPRRNDPTVYRPIADAQLDWTLLMTTHSTPSAVAAVVASAISRSFRDLAAAAQG